MVEAPEHFAFSDRSCYVCKQPQTPVEVDRMINAMQVQELECIRYRGKQRDVQIRLIAVGAGPCCDNLPPEFEPVQKVARTVKHWASALWRRIRH